MLVIVWLWGQFGKNNPRFILTFFEIGRPKCGQFQKRSKWTEGLFSHKLPTNSYYSGLIVWNSRLVFLLSDWSLNFCRSSSFKSLIFHSPFFFFFLCFVVKTKLFHMKKFSNRIKTFEKNRIDAKALFTLQKYASWLQRVGN